MVWLPLLHQVDLKWNLLKRNFFSVIKSFLNQKEHKLFVWSFSRCQIILFSKWIFYYSLFYIRKSATVTHADLLQILWGWKVFLRICLYERRGGTKKREVWKREENHVHIFIELLLDYCIISKNGFLDTYVTTQSTRQHP